MNDNFYIASLFILISIIDPKISYKYITTYIHKVYILKNSLKIKYIL